VVALLLVALSVGLSNFAASIGIGVSGVTGRLRLRIGLVFGVFEAGMPIVGLLLGRTVAHALGHSTKWIAAGLLIATGVYALIQARGQQAESAEPELPHGRLLLTGLALSVDNLAIGFALGTYHVALVTAVIIIGAVSVTLSLIGLELGAKIGTRIGSRGEVLGGAILIGVGAAVAAGII
jgi:putative Mn2+ efflux pump MntP